MAKKVTSNIDVLQAELSKVRERYDDLKDIREGLETVIDGITHKMQVLAVLDMDLSSKLRLEARKK